MSRLISENPKYYTEDLAKSQLLREAGYNLNFSNWPQLFAIFRSARQDSAACKALLYLLCYKLNQLSRGTGDSGNTRKERSAAMIVSSNIGDVIQKVQACLGTMTQVKMRASKQVTTFGYQARTSGPVFEGDSIFVPGQRITFNHDFDQLREGHKSLSTAPLVRSP